MISEKVFKYYITLSKSRRVSILKEIIRYDAFINNFSFITKSNKNDRIMIGVLVKDKEKYTYFYQQNLLIIEGKDFNEIIDVYRYLNRINLFNDNLFLQLMYKYLSKEQIKYIKWEYDFTDEYKKIIKDRHYFNFLLGTGVSIDYGSKPWNLLLEDMTNEIKMLFPTLSIEDIKNYFFANNYAVPQVLKNLDKHRYYDVIYESIYKSGLIPLECNLKKIARHIEKCYYRNINTCVATFNYDDFLEEELMKMHVDFGSEYIKLPTINNEIKIKHIHGYLPRDSKTKSGLYLSKYTNSIVLTEEEYNNAYLDSRKYSYSTLLSFLGKTCLIVGNSLTDYEERKVFRRSKTKNNTFHFRLVKKSSLEFDLYVSSYLLKIGIITIFFDNYDEIGDYINELL